MTSSISSTPRPLAAEGSRLHAALPVALLHQAEQAQTLLDRADIRLGGSRPWDLHVHHPDTLRRILQGGSLALGETYVAGGWDCAQIDAFICRVLRAGLDRQVGHPGRLMAFLRARLLNLQSVARSAQVARVHYDLGNDLYEAMLDPTMAYSCGYWAQASTLAQAQQAKLDLVCRKLGLRPGMRLLDIGCGWGSLMRHAAEHHGVACVGLTVSQAQAQWGQEHAGRLPIRFELCDYRRFNPDGAQTFDAVASVGMFEHVGHKNDRAFLDMARRCLRPDGLFLLHTIGKNRSGESTDPWVEKYIFPNGELPSAAGLSAAVEHAFVIEDWHNFGADYDRTLMAWHQRFEQAWPTLRERYGERFHRLWRYYLLSCAGAFRARDNQLWQLVLSPVGATGGYRRPLA
jgi:cyclopropane-fatty-acyl-phospholipid synthase